MSNGQHKSGRTAGNLQRAVGQGPAKQKPEVAKSAPVIKVTPPKPPEKKGN
jgi:hypothetical protein